ncbi:hypothetical protein ANDA3_3904 [plant metagenome]|uniref:Glycosyltransferase n=1 Tax=plant metagenome TaxID=1297885 RepID=A0A484T2Y7_9ZZZZ
MFRPLTIEDAQVQEFFAASDVVVAPYLATLNSGVALLAATFRRLVVAPRQGAMAEVFAGDDALLYDPDSERGLYDAMRKALVHQVDGASLDGLLMRHRPRQISTVFFARLRERLDLAEYSRDGA